VLSESSYLTAIYVYCGAAIMLLLCLAWWFGRRWPNVWVALLILVTAALLLTPAYPREEVDTLAPALIVAGFQMATEGFESARHALKPLTYSCGFAILLALVFRLVFSRSGRTSASSNAEKAESN
jgi:Ca2+/Na+ antiporter